MFLGKNRKRSNGEVYEYWALCETVRTELGPRQRVVATSGKKRCLKAKIPRFGSFCLGLIIPFQRKTRA
jgi:hypothetical protein